MIIKRLNSDITTKIAAGEVIERPVSVIKELIENSIDANANTITIYVEQGGKTSLVVEDDGDGILYDELPLALERYATSKIEKLDDLDNISTLGYRGEALASIATVSYIEIRSRVKSSKDSNGGIIRSEAGKIVLHSQIPSKLGTRIQVDDLFFNFPARRKFLRTASAELRRIVQILNDYALLHHEKTFRLYSNNKKILEHLPSNHIKEALLKRWGSEAEIYGAETSVETTTAKVWWNPIPDSRRVVISLFVNGRRVQDATVRAAICSGDSVAYGEWLVIIELSPSQLDVNVHPTKEEVRFRKSQDLYRAVNSSTNKIFEQRYVLKTDKIFSLNNLPDCTESNVDKSETVDYKSAHLHIKNIGILNENDNYLNSRLFEPKSAPSNMLFEANSNYIGQTAAGFLLFDFPTGLAILDPHAAHEKILYEEISNTFKGSIKIQKLTIPYDIPESLMPEISINSAELHSLGFEVKRDKLIGVPLLRGKGHLAPIEMLRSVLKGLELENTKDKRDMEIWWRLARLACRDAVKLGQRIDKIEALELMERLQNLNNPFTCPHGRPVIIILENKKIKDWFGR